jgi:hypothetical protein
MEGTKQNRTVMMSEIARIKYNLRDRQKRHIHNQALLPGVRDECHELHLETRDPEEAARRNVVAQTEQGTGAERMRWVHSTSKPENGRRNLNTRSLRNTC